MSARAAIARLVARSLEFQWHHGGCTVIGTHTTGWRDSPHAGMVQIQGLRTTVERQGQAPLWAEPGDALLLDASLHHCLTSEQVGTAPLCRWASCDWLIFGGISAISLFAVPIIQRGARASGIGDACERLAAIFHGTQAADPIRATVEASALGLAVLSALIAEHPLHAHALQLLAHADRLQPVLARIEARLDAPTDRACLARLAGLSPSRFHDLFLEVMRQSPMAYLARRRMQRAQQLLLTTATPIQAIAAQVGYPDPFNFSRAFRRASGLSPRAYRQQTQAWLVPATPGAASGGGAGRS